VTKTQKTWLLIIAGFGAACVIGLIALAGAGVYFAREHIKTQPATAEDARQAFDKAREPFKDQRPLIEVDEFDRPRLRDTASMPTSQTKPAQLSILIWDPDDGRTVRMSLPFWLLRLGRKNIEIGSNDRQVDLENLDLDFDELERIGPALLMDMQRPSGERVLLWTQ
jgi:hypothetical protein